MNREFLRTLIQRLTELPTVWEDEPVPFVAPEPTFAAAQDFNPSPMVAQQGAQLASGSMGQGLVTLTLTPGQEEASWTDYAYDAQAGTRVATTTFTSVDIMSVRVETWGAVPAWTVAKNLSRRVRWPSTIQGLQDNGFAFVEALSLVRLSQTRDTRATQVAVYDFSFRYVEAEVDPLFDGGYILTADVEPTP